MQRWRLVCKPGAAAAILLASLSFGISAAEAQWYGRNGEPIVVRRGFVHGLPPQYYVPQGVGGPFFRQGGVIIPADSPRRFRRGNDHASHQAAEQLRKSPPPPPVKGPLLIAISIAEQKLTLYDDGVPIATSRVSTGTASHPTPMGVFAIIGKERFHRSNLYSAAPMPFMQRITWSGVALHAGVLPGYPASHGCIRMPTDFAIRLYHMTRIGARVVISQHTLTPTEIANAHLFTPKPKPPVEQAVATVNEPSPSDATKAQGKAGGAAAPAVAAGISEKSGQPEAKAESTSAKVKDVVSANANAPEQAGKVSNNESPVKADDGGVVKKDDALVKAEATTPGIAKIAGLRTSVVTPDAPRRLLPPHLRPGAVSVFISRKERRLFVRKGFEPLFDVPVEIANADQPLGTHVFTLMQLDGDRTRWSVVSMPPDRPKTKKVAEVEARKGRYGKHRRSTVDIALAVPPPVTSPAEALDRVTIPQDAVDAISGILSVGASLIISDKDRGPETGEETDFVVLSR